MNVKNCRKCGKIFNYAAGPFICPQCKDINEKKFQIVKKYVQDNKNAMITDVAEAGEVEISQIQQWIREERLVFSDDSPIGINCETCGDMIKTGRYCEKCKNNMAHNLTDAFKKPDAPNPVKKTDEKTSPKMRFL